MKSPSTDRRYALVIASIGCLLGGPIARAGNEVGNGGSVVVCGSKNSPTTVELLDLYEAALLRGAALDKSVKSADPYQIAADRIALLGKIDARSAQIFGRSLERFKKELSLEPEITIRSIDDSGRSFEAPAGCSIRQIAVLRKQALPGEKRLLVDKSLWLKLSAAHQAGLLLHESIYEHLAFLGEPNSLKARYLVSFLMSDRLKPSNGEEYWDIIRKMKLPIYRSTSPAPR